MSLADFFALAAGAGLVVLRDRQAQAQAELVAALGEATAVALRTAAGVHEARPPWALPGERFDRVGGVWVSRGRWGFPPFGA